MRAPDFVFEPIGERFDDARVIGKGGVGFDVVDVGIVSIIGDLRGIEIVGSEISEGGLNEVFGARPIESRMARAQKPAQRIARADGRFSVEKVGALSDE